MGTSKGNIGRAMYSKKEFRDKISKALTLEKVLFNKECPKCGTLFKVKRNLRDGKQVISKKERKFCSIACANSRIQSIEANESRSKKLKGFTFSKNVKPPLKEKECPKCGNLFSKKTKFCSKDCYIKSRIKGNGIKSYRNLCKFKFALSDFPDEFEFSLVEEFGWYSPTNKNNNLGGVSRDHILSVSFGYENKIDPKIISHPANCRLMIHRDNISKNSKSDITLEELLEKIENWNIKHYEVKNRRRRKNGCFGFYC